MASIYEKNSEELNKLLVEETISQNLNEEDITTIAVAEDLLNSDTLYLEADGTDTVLILQDKVNGNVFEAVAASAYSLMSDIYEEAMGDEEADDEDEDEEEEEENEEQNESVEEGEESDEEEDKPEEEFDSEDEKEKTEEALIQAIVSESYTIKSDMNGQGLIVQEGTIYFESIREALIERLIAIAESDDELEIVECVLSAYNSLFIEETGVSTTLLEADVKEKGAFFKKIKAAIKGAPGKSKEALKKLAANFYANKKLTKLGKGSMIGAGALAAGGLAYGGKKLYDKKKNAVKEGIADKAKSPFIKLGRTLITKGGAGSKRANVGNFMMNNAGKLAIGTGAAGVGGSALLAKKLIDKKKKKQNEAYSKTGLDLIQEAEGTSFLSKVPTWGKVLGGAAAAGGALGLASTLKKRAKAKGRIAALKAANPKFRTESFRFGEAAVPLTGKKLLNALKNKKSTVKKAKEVIKDVVKSKPKVSAPAPKAPSGFDKFKAGLGKGLNAPDATQSGEQIGRGIDKVIQAPKKIIGGVAKGAGYTALGATGLGAGYVGAKKLSSPISKGAEAEANTLSKKSK